jgi:glyoxylase-like metal-dependent hydrolase (beta-lactamase superfamily II)
MTHDANRTQPKSPYCNFRRIPASEDWFEVYEIACNLCVFHEAPALRGAIVSLLIGEHKTALIDTGCGIGNLRAAVEAITEKPVMVTNTHTHPDHLGSNRQSTIGS